MLRPMLNGGGLDFAVNRRIAVRLVEADYYFTHLANGVNSEESNLRLSFGLPVWRAIAWT
jgi:hypothetical protein